MLLIANDVDLLIFCCVCFVCDTNMYFSNMEIDKNNVNDNAYTQRVEEKLLYWEK